MAPVEQPGHRREGHDAAHVQLRRGYGGGGRDHSSSVRGDRPGRARPAQAAHRAEPAGRSRTAGPTSTGPSRCAPITGSPPTAITRLITATAVLRLIADERVGIDDPANDHLRTVRLADDAVTVRELLSHAGGVDAPAPRQPVRQHRPQP